MDFSKYSYEYILRQALSMVNDDIDKREGSVIYDALAPACYQLFGFYLELAEVLQATFISTSYDNYLNLRVAEQGLTRIPASKAIKKGYFTNDKGAAPVPIGSRFASVDNDSVIYVVKEPYELNDVPVPGTYLLECEEVGSDGNTYSGDLIPISHITLQTAKLSDLIVPARDEEMDNELRARYMNAVNHKPFGGNVAQYRLDIKNIDGVGEVQIYPTWNGGGTVKCSVIGSNYRKVSDDLIDSIQEQIDPQDLPSVGIGFAPIGHKVTICTPIETAINISCKVLVLMGYTIPQLEPYIKEKVEDYLLTLRKNWGIGGNRNQYQLTVYIAQIMAAILSVSGVANVTDVKINGKTLDLVLQEDAVIQQLPVLGSIAYE